MENSTWIAFLALIIAALGPLATALTQLRLVRMEQREERRQWEHQNMKETLQSLIELRAQLQYLQDKGHDAYPDGHLYLSPARIKELEEQREIAYGKAFGLMLTVPNAKLRGEAGKVMDPVTNWADNEKLAAINNGIMALGNLLYKDK